MVNRQTIKDSVFRPIGFIDTDSVTGNKTVYDYALRVVGFYDAKKNVTKDFSLRIVGYGDLCTSLLPPFGSK